MGTMAENSMTQQILMSKLICHIKFFQLIYMSIISLFFRYSKSSFVTTPIRNLFKILAHSELAP